MVMSLLTKKIWLMKTEMHCTLNTQKNTAVAVNGVLVSTLFAMENLSCFSVLDASCKKVTSRK